MSLQTQNIVYQYTEQKSFRFPDLKLESGGSALLLGPSGSGKSTYLHVLSGLLPPQGGMVKIAGKELYELNNRQRDHFRGAQLGIVFQQNYFLPYLNISENLALAARYRQVANPAEEIMSILKRLQIEHIAKQKPADCSVGEQQRASLARALMGKPAVVLADEPTSALDDANTEITIQLLKEQVAAKNASLLIVTHDQRLKSAFQNIYRL